MLFGPWLGWLLVLGPIVFVVPVSAVSLCLHWYMRRRGVPVEAVCVRSRGLNGHWSCSYRYVDGTGESFHDYSQKPYPLPTPEPGEPVAIVYSPRRPSRSRTQEELRRPVPWAGLNVATYLFVQLVCGVVGWGLLAQGAATP